MGIAFDHGPVVLAALLISLFSCSSTEIADVVDHDWHLPSPSGDSAESESQNTHGIDASEESPGARVEPRTGSADCAAAGTYHMDQDGDGFPGQGAGFLVLEVCAGGYVPDGYVAKHPAGWDCDDGNPDIHPLAVEVCDGVDADCDGDADVALMKNFYRDWDGDGRGGSGSVTACSPPLGYVEAKIDCNDQDAGIYVDATELCDAKDNDCDGQTDEGWHLGQPCVVTYGVCPSLGVWVCAGKYDIACAAPPIAWSKDICDGKDNDCDGVVDNGWECCPVGAVDEVDDCKPSDFVFVIDNSGSMSDNDPLGIRYQGLLGYEDGNGVEMAGFVDKMSSEDRGLIIPFAGTAMEMGTFSSDHYVLKNNVSLAKGAWVGFGTEVGNALMNHAVPAFPVGDDREKFIILLTDGCTADEYAYSRTAIAQAMEDHGIFLLAVGLGAGVDSEYLTAVSKSRFFHIAVPGDIPTIYDKIFAVATSDSWKECSEDHVWVDKTGGCSEPCDDGKPPDLFWTDFDGDGYGIQASIDEVLVGCDVPGGYSIMQGDCDDQDPGVYPGNVEVADGKDNDCDLWNDL